MFAISIVLNFAHQKILPVWHTGKERLHHGAHKMRNALFERWSQILENVAPVLVQQLIETVAEQVARLDRREMHVESKQDLV